MRSRQHRARQLSRDRELKAQSTSHAIEPGAPVQPTPRRRRVLPRPRRPAPRRDLLPPTRPPPQPRLLAHTATISAWAASQDDDLAAFPAAWISPVHWAQSSLDSAACTNPVDAATARTRQRSSANRHEPDAPLQIPPVVGIRLLSRLHQPQCVSSCLSPAGTALDESV